MANLKNFLNPNFLPNRKFNIYHELARTVSLGDAIPLIVKNLHVKVKGSVSFAGHVFKDIVVEVIMPDESPSGRCTLIFGSTRLENVPYKTRGNDLVIEPENFPLSEIVLQRGNREWTWFGLKYGIVWLGWFGTWPANKEINQEDLDAVPQQIKQTVA